MTLYRRRREAGLIKRPEPAPFDEGFFEEWSDSMAWLLGVIWTDGCIFGNTVEVCSKDLQLIELILACIGGRYGLKNGGHHLRVTFTAKRTADRLRALGLHERKSLTVKWPVGLPDEYVGAFMRGVLDGDGSVLTNCRRSGQQVPDVLVQIVSASPAFAQSMASQLEGAGVTAATSVREQSNPTWAPVWKVVVRRQDSLRRLHGMLYPSEDVPCLHRKRVAFDDWMQTPRARPGRPARH